MNALVEIYVMMWYW